MEEFTAAVRVIDDLGVVVHETTALFVQFAAELDMPLLTTDARLKRAATGSAPIELIQGTQKPDPA